MTIQTFEETDYIELAKQAGFFVWTDEQKTIEGYGEDLEAFAKLVAEKSASVEREACAKLSQTLPNPYKHCQISSHAYDMAIVDYSKAIRARGATE